MLLLKVSKDQTMPPGTGELEAISAPTCMGQLTSCVPYSLTKYRVMASVLGVLSSIATCITFSPTGPLAYTLLWLGNSLVIICTAQVWHSVFI